ITHAIDLILTTEIEHQAMREGISAPGPCRMPEGGRVAVNGMRRGAIFAYLFLAIHGQDPHLLLGNETLPWRVCREYHAYLVGDRAFRAGTVESLHRKVIRLSGGEILHGIRRRQAYRDYCLILTALRAIVELVAGHGGDGCAIGLYRCIPGQLHLLGLCWCGGKCAGRY